MISNLNYQYIFSLSSKFVKLNRHFIIIFYLHNVSHVFNGKTNVRTRRFDVPSTVRLPVIEEQNVVCVCWS